MLASAAPYLAVMDADLQHDERLLPKMLAMLRADQADLAIGSRYIEGGSAGNFADDRVAMSRLATRLALAATRVRVADPMSGFFMLTAPLFRACMRDLTATGFKILLDLLASAPDEVRVCRSCRTASASARQAPASSTPARHGTTRCCCSTRRLGRYIPTRFIVFSAVGALGVAVHMAVLALLFKSDALSFGWAQGWATLVAMTFNFALNNAVTYRDRKLRGLAWFGGWLTFVLACSIGAAANVGIAEFLFERNQWWATSAIAGILIGAVWNYAVTSTYTWHAT